MNDFARPMHYVATLDEARALVRERDRFWVSVCGCRQAAGRCGQSRMDVCLYFTPDFTPTGKHWRAVSRGEAEEILSEAKEKRLVCRPFRDERTRIVTAGICFCCRDCCGYFRDPSEACDKGESIAITHPERCTHCAACVESCPFDVREMIDGRLTVRLDRCYGCGLCVPSCPADGIRLVARRGPRGAAESSR